MLDKLDVSIAILCDDVRVEINNKLIFVGVYVGDVVVAEFPAPLQLCTVVAFTGLSVGTHEFELRLTAPERTGSLKGNIEVSQDHEPATISSPKFPITFKEQSEIKVELKVDDGPWRTLISKRIVKGEVAGI